MTGSGRMRTKGSSQPRRLRYPNRIGRVGARHLFPDGKARRLEIRVNGLARTAAMMETAARELGVGDPWLGTDGIVHDAGDLLDAQPLPLRLLQTLSPAAEVIMPATVRPAEPAARAAGHAIERLRTEFDEGGGARAVRVEQRARARLRFGRGWFSSGVDERVGLVMWPPNQAVADAAGMDDNIVKLRTAPDADDRTPTLPVGACPTPPLGDPPVPTGGRDVPLPDFQDADLGPGGRFVTRRGMDPTLIPGGKLPDGETQIFLSKDAFPDLWRHPADPALAEYVPHALMPLGDADGTADGGSDENAVDTVPPLACGLVTYAPRFDPIAEEWYCDVHLEPGSRADQIVRFGVVRYQPHTRPDLRCSRPVQVFCQPLSDRRVDIRFDTTKRCIVVTMTGKTSCGRVFEHMKGKPAPELEAVLKERETNVMRVTAFVDGEAPLGGATREHVALIPDALSDANAACIVKKRRDTGVVEVQYDGGASQWRALIPLAAIPRGQLAGLSLRIEEIDYRLSADFRDTLGEPVGFLEKLGISANAAETGADGSAEDGQGGQNEQSDGPTEATASIVRVVDALVAAFRERNSGLDVTEPLSGIVPSEVVQAHARPRLSPAPT